MNETTKKPKSAFDLYPKSVELIKKNLNIFALVYAVPVLLTVLTNRNSTRASSIASFSGTGYNSANVNIHGLFGVTPSLGAVLLVVAILSQVMAVGLTLRSARGKSSNLSQLWELARKYTFRYIGLMLLFGFIVMIGFIMLIVPGLIFLRRYILAPYIMIDEDKGIIDSLAASSELTKAFSMSVWGLLGVTFLIAIGSSVLTSVLGIVGAIFGTLLTIGYAFAPALRYVELKKLSVSN